MIRRLAWQVPYEERAEDHPIQNSDDLSYDYRARGDWCHREKAGTRLVIEAEESCEDSLTLSADEEGLVIVSVAQEQAVDSYNVMFDCQIHLTEAQALQVKQWFMLNVPDPILST